MVDHTAGNLVYGLAVLMESLMGVLAATLTRRNSGIGTLTGQMCGGAIAFAFCAVVLKSQFPFAVPSVSLVNYWPLLYLIFLAGLITFVIWSLWCVHRGGRRPWYWLLKTATPPPLNTLWEQGRISIRPITYASVSFTPCMFVCSI